MPYRLSKMRQPIPLTFSILPLLSRPEMEQNRTTTFAAFDTDVSTASAAAAAAATAIDNINKKRQSIRNTGEEGDQHGGVAVHSRVRKIKQEIEKLNQPSLEIRRLLLRNINRQRSRSPLGVAERTILVGN